MPRSSPRALALWGAAAVVAVITATVVAGDLATLHRRTAELGPERDAVVATRDLAVGTVLRTGDLSTRRVRRSQLPAIVITDRARIVGRVVAVPVLRGAYVVGRNLAPRRRTGLDGVVPRGMRAMRVVVTDAIEPRPGAVVDVFATEDAGASGAADGTTTVVAAGVTVIGTDHRGATGNGRAGAGGVTLLVDPNQAATLADAQTRGVVTLALVPPEEAARR